MREPDWNALNDLQFILYGRIVEALNEAQSDLAFATGPDARDKPPGYWRARASEKIASLLNLFNAWSYLIQYKVDPTTAERALRPFHANDLLQWIARQLQWTPAPRLESNPLLHGNQETLQEALLLLHSTAYAFGTAPQLELEASQAGVWFHVQFERRSPLPATFEDLLAGPTEHWRARQTAFELATARDFIAMNGSQIALASAAKRGAFLFFVPAVGATLRQAPPPTHALQSADARPSPAADGTRFERLTPGLARLLREVDAAVNGKLRPKDVEVVLADDQADTPPVQWQPPRDPTGEPPASARHAAANGHTSAGGKE